MGNPVPIIPPVIDPDLWYCCQTHKWEPPPGETGCQGIDHGIGNCCVQGWLLQGFVDGGGSCVFGNTLCALGMALSENLLKVSHPFDSFALCQAAC